MSTRLLMVVTLIYLWVAVENFMMGKPAMSLVFAAYAVANCGLMLA